MSTRENSWSERHHKNFLIELKKIHQHHNNIDTTQFIEQIKILEIYSLDKNRVFALFSQVDFYFLYLSKSVTNVIGHTPAEIYKKGLRLAFKVCYWKQLPLAIKVHQWGDMFRKALGEQAVTAQQEIFFCGVKSKDKQGKWKVFFLKQKILSTNEAGIPTLSFLDIEEITTIYKSDYVWTRMVAKTDNTTISRAYFQEGKKKEYADILSVREIEILRLIIEKKDNMTISETLGISKNTVERHRKNMIARLGVTDMTALIHVCQLCQFL